MLGTGKSAEPIQMSNYGGVKEGNSLMHCISTFQLKDGLQRKLSH